MGFLKCVNPFGRSKNNRLHQARPTGFRPQVECLETRDLPNTVTFLPDYGKEIAHVGSGNTLSNTPVYLIFWGSGWQQSAYSTSASDVQNATDTFLSSPYLSGLTQYGSDGQATYAGSVFDTSNPPRRFRDSRLQQVVFNAFENLGLPQPDAAGGHPLYMVITPPGIRSHYRFAGGYHSLTSSGQQNVLYGWIGNNGTLDGITSVLSHEVSESISDPGLGSGVTVSHPRAWHFGGDFEIADAEAQNFTYRVDNVLVQSYWSQQDNAYTIPTDESASKTLFRDNTGVFNDVASYSWSTDNSTLYVLGNNNDFWQDRLGKITLVTTVATSFALGPAGTVYFMTQDNSLYQDARNRIKLLGNNVSDYDVGGNPRYLYFLLSDGTLERKLGNRVRQVDTSVQSISLSADGHTLFAFEQDGDVKSFKA